MTQRRYSSELAEWLRDLAAAVEAHEVNATDVAQALFAGEGYRVACPLSESGATGLLERTRALYPVPPLSGPLDPSDARWDDDHSV
jgi:hypothetical protein